MSTRVQLLGLCLVLGLAASGADDPSDQAGSRAVTLYRVRAGESLQDIAAKFLGGAEYLPELLRFNQIQNPSAVSSGFTVAIPGPIRQEAITALNSAEEALARAVAVEAETYAPEDYLFARDTIAGAREARLQANYDKALALSQLGTARAEEARSQADLRAPVQQDGRVVHVHGNVLLSKDDGKTWDPVRNDAGMAVTDILRTGEKSRAAVLLADGSTIQVMEKSEFQIMDFLLDPRNGLRKSRLRVILGNIMGRIKPRGNSDSRFEIKSGDAAIAIRGTELRVGRAKNGTAFVSVLEGETLLSARAGNVVVPANHGSFVRKGAAPAAPVELLASPATIFPEPGPLTTAIQTLKWKWNELKHASRERYRLEIARDEAFTEIIQNTVTGPDDDNLAAEVLPDGTYFWRLSTIDRNGIEGPPGKPHRLEIVVDLAVDLVPSMKPVVWNDRRVVAPGTTFSVRPENTENSIQSYEYSIDNGSYSPLSKPPRLTEGGRHVVRVRAIGADGTRGAPEDSEIVVDDAPPQISHEAAAMEEHPTLGKVTRVTLAARDDTAVSEIMVRVDRGPFTRYETPLLLSAYDTHTIRVRATDVLGNCSTDYEFEVQGEWVPASR